ncbi:hypothetical protein K2173_018393 [Erythroxylum novogranatense]|uniref:C2H2-type domain-containing protein n=1 Tax=Erythroxylum novogranatense TaxID=1862640 RepID=A0AAV8UAB9_9ROSI|nr:hypothetical protein K2173_018393 [Erythroxylum novogranatense]
MEDSKSSSEETDLSEQINDDSPGTVRSYECVFCKRGFTSAQALGGHMNIHRKDRAKPSPSSVDSISSKVDDDYSSFRAYSAIQSHPPHYPMSQQVQINYQTYFPPPTTWGARSQHAQHIDDLCVQSPQHLNPCGEDWSRNLSIEIGPSHEEKREDGRKDELDLELRLGHHHY